MEKIFPLVTGVFFAFIMATPLSWAQKSGKDMKTESFFQPEAEVRKSATALYSFLNRISDGKNDFNKKDLHEYFSPDFLLYSNGELLADGIPALFEYIQKVRSGSVVSSRRLPFDEIIVSPDQRKIVLRYTLKIGDKNDPKKSRPGHVIAIWQVGKDGRYQRVDEVVHSEQELNR